MDMPWTCPNCRTLIRYTDYERVLRRLQHECHGCGLPVAVDKRTDELVVADPRVTKRSTPAR